MLSRSMSLIIYSTSNKEAENNIAIEIAGNQK